MWDRTGRARKQGWGVHYDYISLPRLITSGFTTRCERVVTTNRIWRRYTSSILPTYRLQIDLISMSISRATGHRDPPYCLLQIELHEFLDGKISVVHDEGAGKWVCLLDSVAREVKNVHV
jgi:hypothetical protein